MKLTNEKAGLISVVIGCIIYTFINRRMREEERKLNEEANKTINEFTEKLVRDAFPVPDFTKDF